MEVDVVEKERSVLLRIRFMDELERKQIVDEVMEKMLLMIPDVIGSLISNHVALARINREFYSRYPEFKDKRDLVASVVEMIEGQNTFEDYNKILELAVPEIRRRLKQIKHLSMEEVKAPDKDLHGVI